MAIRSAVYSMHGRVMIAGIWDACSFVVGEIAAILVVCMALMPRTAIGGI